MLSASRVMNMLVCVICRRVPDWGLHCRRHSLKPTTKCLSVVVLPLNQVNAYLGFNLCTI